MYKIRRGSPCGLPVEVADFIGTTNGIYGATIMIGEAIYNKCNNGAIMSSPMQRLKEHLMIVKSANILELSQQAGVDVDITRDMLQLFIRKGYVSLTPKPAKCSQCSKCNPLTSEIYGWLQ